MFMNPYISRELARERQRDMLTHARHQRLALAAARRIRRPGSGDSGSAPLRPARSRWPAGGTPDMTSTAQRWPARGPRRLAPRIAVWVQPRSPGWTSGTALARRTRS